MKQIKFLERLNNSCLDMLIKGKIRKMFAYIGCDDIEFIDPDDPFTEGNEHFVAYRTLSGSLKQYDIDFVIKEMFKEKNYDGIYRTIVLDIHEGRILSCNLHEYGYPDPSELEGGTHLWHI